MIAANSQQARAQQNRPRTFDDIRAVWHRTGTIPRPDAPTAAELAADRYDGSVPVAQWLSEQAAARAAEAARYRWKIAAAVAIISLSVLLALATQSVLTDRGIETHAGDWHTVELTDGSTVHAGPRTKLRFSFGDDRRLVRLVRGEAYFEVAKDPGRPFTVNSDLINVRAVGTSFSVTRLNDTAIVIVKSGVVNVSRNHTADVTILSAGEQATVSADDGRVVKKRIDTARALAWVAGQLEFDACCDTVAAAAYEFNRRNRVQIEIADASVATLTIDGIFPADDPEALVRFLERQANVTTQRDRPDIVRVLPGPMPGHPSDSVDTTTEKPE